MLLPCRRNTLGTHGDGEANGSQHSFQLATCGRQITLRGEESGDERGGVDGQFAKGLLPNQAGRDTLDSN